MDQLNYEAPVARLLVERGFFEHDPFVLFDVGCSGGLDAIWRIFGDSLIAHGFDGRADECRRLQSIERNPNVNYHPEWIGLPASHEWVRRKAAAEQAAYSYTEIVFDRTSTRKHGHPGLPLVNFQKPDSSPEPAPPKTAIADFAARERLANLDFIKIDTDGGDLEAVLSAEPCIDSLGVLGFLVESPYQGSDADTSNSFHNIDRVMKRHGSRAALPAPYMYNIFAQTTFGQPVFGDIAFMRDPLWGSKGVPLDLSIAKLLKLICLYEFFRVPDCAAELILLNRERIAALIEPDHLLDLLTPQLAGRTLSYREYARTIDENPSGLLARSLDFSEEDLRRLGGRDLPGLVGDIRILNRDTRIKVGTPMRIVTAPGAWAYAAELPLAIPMHLPGAIWIRIRVRVLRGACAFGLLNQNRSAFQHRRILQPHEQDQTVFLHAEDRSSARSVIIENATPDGQPAEIDLSEACVAIVDLPHGVPLRPPGVFTRVWRALRA